MGNTPNQQRHKSQYQMIEMLERAKADFEIIVEHQQYMAKLKKSAFDAYIKAGFSEEQAFSLCSSSPFGV